MSFLYTVVPPEEVWNEDSSGEDAPALQEVTYRGVRMLVRPTAEGAVIERLLTTDPYAYLRPDLQPGLFLDGVIP